MRALVVALALAAGAPDDRLAQGEVLVWTEQVAGSDVPVGFAQGVIDAPPAEVWKIVEDCGNYAQNMPRIAKSKLEKQEGTVRFCRVTADLPFPAPDLESLTRVEHAHNADGSYVRAWKLVEGDYHRNEGTMTLKPYGDGTKTLATYRIHVEPKLPLPQSVMSSMQKGSLPDVIKNLRKRLARQ